MPDPLVIKVPVPRVHDAGRLLIAALVRAWSASQRALDEAQKRESQLQDDLWDLAALARSSPQEASRYVADNPDLDRELWMELQADQADAEAEYLAGEPVENEDGSVDLETAELDDNDVTSGTSKSRWESVALEALPPAFREAATSIVGALGARVSKAARREVTHYDCGLDVDGGTDWRAAGDVTLEVGALSVSVDLSLMDGDRDASAHNRLTVTLAY